MLNLQKCPPPSIRAIFGGLTLVVALFSACKSTSEVEPPLPKLGDAYAGLTVGRYIEYQADSVIYDPQPLGNIKIDTFRLQIREKIVDTFIDVQGMKRFRVEYSERKNATEAWNLKSIKTATIGEQNVERTEGNLRFVVMPLFFNEKTAWTSTVFINPDTEISVADEKITPFSKRWSATVVSFDKAETIGGKAFAQVLTTRAQTPASITNEKRYLLEKYAKGVGLVSRELHILDTQDLDANATWEKRAQRGFILKMTVLTHN